MRGGILPNMMIKRKNTKAYTHVYFSFSFCVSVYEGGIINFSISKAIIGMLMQNIFQSGWNKFTDVSKYRDMRNRRFIKLLNQFLRRNKHENIIIFFLSFF